VWGIATALGLLVGLFAGGTLHWLREANARAVRRGAAALEAGDVRTLARLHAAGLGRDAVRAATVTAVGLGAGWLLARSGVAALPPSMLTLSAALVAGAALAAGASGLLRLVGRGSSLRWFAAGVAGAVAVLAVAVLWIE
jgi:hypothetical protein